MTGHDPLSPAEARVLGSLVEKAMTTPEYYPLTLNALVAACNQRSNRDPVVELDEATVTAALRSLEDRGLAGLTRSPGGRSVKYVHRAGDALQVDDRQLALLAVLLLRGAQTPGELRSRTDRYPSLAHPEAVDEGLTDLVERDRPLVRRLARAPGQKEHRYRCVLAGDGPVTPGPAPVVRSVEERIASLERRVEELERRGEEGRPLARRAGRNTLFTIGQRGRNALLRGFRGSSSGGWRIAAANMERCHDGVPSGVHLDRRPRADQEAAIEDQDRPRRPGATHLGLRWLVHQPGSG